MNRRIKDAFDSVKADERMKNKTKETLFAELDRPPKRRFFERPVLRRALAAAAVFVLVFTFGMRTWQIKAEAASLLMEGPVQISLSVNDKDTIISAKGLNTEGKQVLSQVDVKGMHYEEALQAIMATDSYQQYQGEKAKVKVSCHDDEQKAVLQQNADETCHAYGQEYREHHGSEHKDETNNHNKAKDHSEEENVPEHTEKGTKRSGHGHQKGHSE